MRASTAVGSPLSPTATRGRRHRGRIWAYLILIAVGVVMLYPLIWLLSSSLKHENQIFTTTTLWPSAFNWRNYVDGWSAIGVPFSQFLVNSFILCVGVIIGNVVSCTLAAYAFARMKFRLRNFWFTLMISTLLLPQHVTLIPQYIIFNHLGWVNTDLPLIIPKFLATDAFFVFLAVQFIRTLPGDLDDAAKLDGCGPLRTFWYIILPLLTPAIVTTVIFSFIWTYNDFFGQLIYLNSPNLFTVPLGLRLFEDESGTSAYGQLFAMSVLALIPVFLVFLFLQRFFVRGIAMTGMKA